MTGDAGERAAAAFRRRYGAEPTFLASAPGRVNLMGDHTDYQDGFVMPMALEQRAVIAFRRRADRYVGLEAVDLGSHRMIDLDALEHRRGDWSEYLSGVASELSKSGYHLSGWEGSLAGDVPRGSGLSSSAAFEVAATRAFSGASGFAWSALEMALVSQRAENDWVGMQCGIMDQLIAVAAVPGAALLIDCRSLETTPVELPTSVEVVIMDTSTRRELVGSEYNVRRGQCETAANLMAVPTLRDTALVELDNNRDRFDQVVFRRARHVITENARVRTAFGARSDPDAFGALMTASHASLRNDFEVSSPALDAMVEAALASPGCYGARLTGAGFAGAVVALVDARHATEFKAATKARFDQATGLASTLFSCKPGRGSSLDESEGVQ